MTTTRDTDHLEGRKRPGWITLVLMRVVSLIGAFLLVAPLSLAAQEPQKVALQVPVRPLSGAATRKVTVPPPNTPDGVPKCTEPLDLDGDLPRRIGEAVRYVVDVNGLSVGTVDFKIERQGTYEGSPVTEYRSLFKLDSFVASFVPVEGRAAALVPSAAMTPLKAMSRYKVNENSFEEDIAYSRDGHHVASKRTKNGQAKDDKRAFPSPAMDFVSGFYMIRTLPAQMSGCAIVYGNQRAYTIWVKHKGVESVRTPVGSRNADVYEVLYGHDKSKEKLSGSVWLAQDASRLPYKMKVKGKQDVEARVHVYEAGATSN
jgi:hypothetical protein